MKNSFFTKIKKYLRSSYLCIKYPFLYPRNRWDGKHHNYFEWTCSLINKLYKKAYSDVIFGYKFYKDPTENTVTSKYIELNSRYSATYLAPYIYIFEGTKEVGKFNVNKHVGKNFYVTGITLSHTILDNPIIIYHVCRKEPTTTNHGFSYKKLPVTKSKYYIFWYKTVKLLEAFLDKIFILPGYTELDALPSGWYKAFGLQICKEIKQALLKAGGRKALMSYRIAQIKEKWGYLHWYDNSAIKEVHDVIGKYEAISLKTCIHCGKPATKISLGWISPYCDECIGNSNYEDIDEYYKDVDDNEC